MDIESLHCAGDRPLASPTNPSSAQAPGSKRAGRTQGEADGILDGQTGDGHGRQRFQGSYVVEKLRERGAREIIVPRSREHDLTEQRVVRSLLADEAGSRHPPGRR